MPYGPDAADACVEIAADLGSPAAEYAAIRRGAGVMDAGHRGTLRVTGADRVAFLQRMVTQDLKELAAGGVRESFWLNRKGRVQADLLIGEFGDEMLVDVDRFAAAAATSELGAFLFSEDVQIADATATTGRLALHGAAALQLLRSACGAHDALAADLSCLALSIAGSAVRAIRRDQTGAPGVELFMPIEAVGPVFDALLATPMQ
jgi:glycine cleavage system aminomethyltransferase T